VLKKKTYETQGNIGFIRSIATDVVACVAGGVVYEGKALAEEPP